MKTERVQSLDLLRCVAILLVMIFHFPKKDGISVFGAAGDIGFLGVDLFFVLSGYLIANQIFTRILSGQGFSFKIFYLRRAFRTFPSYFVVVALYFLVPEFREHSNLPPIWRFLTFTQNFNLSFSAFSQAWSLCVEEHFYLLFPLIVFSRLRFSQKRNLYFLFFAIVLFEIILRALLWTYFVKESPNPIEPFFRKIVTGQPLGHKEWLFVSEQ